MRKRGISPVERAVICAKWRKDMIDSKIHALIGDDSDRVVNLAGRMFFVALGAALHEEIGSDDADIRIIRGAVNAMYDQAGEAQIANQRRASIASGLEAVSRLCQRVEQKSLNDAACDLELRLRSADVHISDFDRLVEAIA